MATESYYLDSLQNPELYLDSPLPLEISGGAGNYVASWEETKIEGEGPTKDEAIEDARKAIIAKYKSIEAKLLKGERVRDPDETIWVSMCHYIASNTRGRVRQGEEQSIQSTRDPNYKGPIFG